MIVCVCVEIDDDDNIMVLAYSHNRRGSSPAGLLHELREDQVQLLGHCWSGEVWWTPRWLLVCVFH